ncbi:hypothetical protein C7H09_14465 [Marinobacter fuscus]|uniref:Uncharacterized protein n=1 Tax=Marinobacter fuscus TaxID=2109942 RepID=A0A2T1K6W7_9GAMM|nr:hypothetical protein [Marinobacter fuscus]PSF05503.1 hypothetical protein C7H09_14465 [Marinobacter fuscus]
MTATPDTLRSSRNSRVGEIINALKAAHDHGLSACQKSLREMPEYFMVTRVGAHFAEKFSNFNYHLEASVAEILTKARVSPENQDSLQKYSELRANGRFDLTLFTRKGGKPAHIIEFKKGTKLESLKKDIDRISLLADAVPQGSRLETNYLVFITKRNTERSIIEWDERLQEIVKLSLIGQGHITNNITCSVRDVWKSPAEERELTNGKRHDVSPFVVVIAEIRCN